MLVWQGSNERNYHIFYQLLEGASQAERQQFCLEQSEHFQYLNSVQVASTPFPIALLLLLLLLLLLKIACAADRSR